MGVRRILPVALGVLLAGLNGCAAQPGGTHDEATAATAKASCVGEAIAPFSCNVYLVAGAETDMSSAPNYLQFQNAEAWFEQSGQTTQLVLERGNRRIHVPVTISGSTAVTRNTPDSRFTTARCRANEDCKFRAWLAGFFASPVTISRDGSDLIAKTGQRRITGQLTKRPHAYPNLQPKTAAGRTLLTYHPTGNGGTMTAFNGGNLSTNKSGCLTDGHDVLVLADTTRLNTDGSIDIDGRHIRQGQRLNIGGGEATPPEDTRCGIDLDYWYF